MSMSLDPTLRGLDDCGCDGATAETPLALDNRPGLAAVAYRIGTHSRFKESMLARLSSADLPALRALTTREDADFSIALLDAFAAMADVLTFYQERIANEAFLGTATERRSLVELARLIGYTPRPGVAASAFLAFTLEDAEGAPAELPVPTGVRVLSVPGPDERPQTFETIEPIVGRPEWNAMRPVLVQKHPDLASDSETITVRGAVTNVQRGDSLLLVTGGGADDRYVKRVTRVVADGIADQTRIDLADDPPDPPQLQLIALAPALFTITPLKLNTVSVQSAVLGARWKQADLTAFTRVQRWPLKPLMLNLALQVALKRRVFPAESGAFALRQRAALFGHNAPKYGSLPANQRVGERVINKDGTLTSVPPAYPDSWENRTLANENTSTSRNVDLDGAYPGIAAGSWLVLESASARRVYRVEDNSELTRSDFTISAKVSRVRVDGNAGFGSFSLRGTTVLAQSERFELAELPILDPVKGSSLVLDQAYLGLAVGRPVIVSGERSDLAGVRASEVVLLTDVILNEGLTELHFAPGLAHEYLRSSVTVNANVARATHGETKEEALGGGDTTVPFQRFTLRQAPLTYIGAETETGAASTLELRVGGVRWDEVPFFFGRGPDERIYITRADEEGRTVVQFGDGRTGARPPTGQENIRARYRQGMGEEGLVDAGQLTLLQTRPLGVRGVANPVAAADAAGPERRDEVRRNAPLPIYTLGRIVSLRDYEDFARAFSGVAKALVTWTWDGRQRGVFVTVSGPGGAPIAEGGSTYSNLLAAMRKAGDPLVALRVATYTQAYFQLAAKVRVDPAYRDADVLAAVEAALREAFGFAARDFGQPVSRSEVIATIQRTQGVTAVDLDELFRSDAGEAELAAGKLFERLTAAVPRSGGVATLGAELLTLDPRPLRLEAISL